MVGTPSDRRATMSGFLSIALTVCPNCARHTDVTSPAYPVPKMPSLILLPHLYPSKRWSPVGEIPWSILDRSCIWAHGYLTSGGKTPRSSLYQTTDDPRLVYGPGAPGHSDHYPYGTCLQHCESPCSCNCPAVEGVARISSCLQPTTDAGWRRPTL